MDFELFEYIVGGLTAGFVLALCFMYNHYTKRMDEMKIETKEMMKAKSDECAEHRQRTTEVERRANNSDVAQAEFRTEIKHVREGIETLNTGIASLNSKIDKILGQRH